mgnify:CR=1 FL=1
MNSKWTLPVLSYRPTRELGIRRNQGRLFVLASSVKQIAQEGLARLAPVLVIAVVALLPLGFARSVGGIAARSAAGLTLRMFDELVQLTPVQRTRRDILGSSRSRFPDAQSSPDSLLYILVLGIS